MKLTEIPDKDFNGVKFLNARSAEKLTGNECTKVSVRFLTF